MEDLVQDQSGLALSYNGSNHDRLNHQDDDDQYSNPSLFGLGSILLDNDLSCSVTDFRIHLTEDMLMESASTPFPPDGPIENYEVSWVPLAQENLTSAERNMAGSRGEVDVPIPHREEESVSVMQNVSTHKSDAKVKY